MNAPAELRLRRGDALPEAIPLVRDRLMIGRTGADLVLDDAAVSRRHCELVHQPGGWSVRDLGSSNGTYLNGERILERPLKDGDRLRLGQSELEFKEGAAPVEAAPARTAGNEPAGRHGGLTDDTAIWNVIELSVGAGSPAGWRKAYLETLLRRFQCERGCVIERDPVTGVVVPVAAVAMEFVESGPEGTVPFSRSIVEQAIRDRVAVATTNAEVDPRFRDADSVAQYDIRAVLCAPARWQGSPVGAVYLERTVGTQPFTDADAAALQDLADLLGVAEMAWRGHLMASREEWERDQLLRNFAEGSVAGLLGRGGTAAVRRQPREVTVVAVYLARLDGIIASGNEEAWRLISQLYGQVADILLRHGGALTAAGIGQFGALDAEPGAEDPATEAVRAGVDIQRAARPLVKRFAREFKQPIAVGVGIGTGQVLTGYFGAGRRVDFLGLGEPVPVATGLAFQAEDGEVLIDHATFGRVRIHFTPHRLAPVTLPGVARQVQLYRVVSY